MRYFVTSNKENLSQTIKTTIVNSLSKISTFIFDEQNPEIVISVGGDGRLLKTISKYKNSIEKIKFVGISTGNLGFLCEYHYSQLEEFLDKIIKENYIINSYPLIKVKYKDYEDYFLNEVRIEKKFNTLSLNVFINGTEFENFKGNGLNFATPIGSTAYNRSLGGSIVNPKLECFIMGEIASINHNKYTSLNSFLILNKYDIINLRGNFFDCILGGDTTHLEINEDEESQLEITLSNKYVNFISLKNENYYQKLKRSYIKGVKND